MGCSFERGIGQSAVAPHPVGARVHTHSGQMTSYIEVGRDRRRFSKSGLPTINDVGLVVRVTCGQSQDDWLLGGFSTSAVLG